MIELLTGSPPYKNLPKEQAICKIVDNEKPPYPPAISSDLQKFLDLCFVRDPEKRATIKDLLQHPWIMGNIRNYKNKKNSVNYSKDPSTINDLYDVLRSFNKTVNDTDFTQRLYSYSLLPSFPSSFPISSFPLLAPFPSFFILLPFILYFLFLFLHVPNLYLFIISILSFPPIPSLQQEGL